MKRHSKDGFVKNTRASPAEIRLRAEKAKKNIGVGGPKKEDKVSLAVELVLTMSNYRTLCTVSLAFLFCACTDLQSFFPGCR